MYSENLLDSFKKMDRTVLTLFMLVLSGVICRRPEFKSGWHKSGPNWLLPMHSLQHFEHHIVHSQ